MKKRGLSFPVLGLLVVLMVGGAVASAAAAETNLLIVTIDTLRPDRLSCYDKRFAATPAIDALAARGALFERAFAHDPITLPSHANIFLGLTPPAHGVTENSKTRVGLDFLTMAEYLKGRGYATGAFIGAFPLDSRFGLDQGFDVYDDTFPQKSTAPGIYPERRADEVLAAAKAWLDGRTGKWFCWVHLWDPHAPYSPPEPYLTQYAGDPYSGEAAYVDSQLAVFFDDLDKKSPPGKTLAVLTSDHGESLGEHGELTHSYFAYNSTIHVPLIIAGPGVRASRVRTEASHVDIFPTVCGLLGIESPPALQGRSLVPLMNGSADTGRPIYFESLDPYYNKSCAPLRGFIADGKKFIDTPIPELYDLRADFGEAKNLASTTDLSSYRKRLEDLKKELTTPAGSAAPRTTDRQALERLRSLGYTAAPVATTKASYGPEDDVKTVLPIQQKLERAIILSDQGKPDESIKETNSLIALRKDFAPAYLLLSQVLMAQNRQRDAIKVMDAAVRNIPGDYSMHTAYGRILIQTAQWDKAQEILEKALSLVDDEPEGWDHLGIVHLRKGNPEKALEAFRKALALDPNFALAHLNVGAALMEIYFSSPQPERLAEAIDHLKKAAALNPSMNLAFRGLATAYQEAGRTDEALAAWEKAVVSDPADDFSILNLGRAYLAKGDKFRARRCFERILVLKGDRIGEDERERLQALIDKCR
jgi:arylsulfatase A-like enzyme/Flp pilus assembly protein TadD